MSLLWYINEKNVSCLSWKEKNHVICFCQEIVDKRFARTNLSINTAIIIFNYSKMLLIPKVKFKMVGDFFESVTRDKKLKMTCQFFMDYGL